MTTVAVIALAGCVTIESSGGEPQWGGPSTEVDPKILAATLLSPETGLPVMPKQPGARPAKSAGDPKARVAAGKKTGAARATPRTDEPVPEPSAPIPVIQLVGLDEEQLRATLGPPVEQWQTAPAKVWRYRQSACTMDVLLYPDVQTLTFRVLKYEVTNDEYAANGRPDCVAERRFSAAR